MNFNIADGFHTTSINDSIRPTKNDIIDLAVKNGLNKKEAELIFERMFDIMNNEVIVGH